MYTPELISLLPLNIPEGEQAPIGFLEVTGIAHRENENSKVYAFFLNQENYPELSSLFLTALLQIVQEKTTKKIDLLQFQTTTEVSTINRKRIDIALEDMKNKKAIIIENKIYHTLENDLLEYWQHYDYKVENKLGILLTLEPHIIPDYVVTEFINVTHIQWITKIQELGLPSKLPQNIYTYLNDFFKTIEYLTNNIYMNDQARFYFEHTKKVLLAKETEYQGLAFIEGQLNELAQKMEWEFYNGSSLDNKNIWDSRNNLNTFYTIGIEELMKGNPTIQINIELFQNDRFFSDELDITLKENFQYNHLEKRVFKNKLSLYYLSKSYPLTFDEIEDLSGFIKEKIDNDFKDVMEAILKFIYKDKYRSAK